MFHAAADSKIGGFSSPQPQPQPLKNEFSLDPLRIMSPSYTNSTLLSFLFRILSALKLKNMWVPTLSFKPSKMSPITFTAHRFNFPQLHDPRNLGFVSLSRQTFKYLGFPPLPQASKPQKIAPSPNTQTLAMVSLFVTSQPPKTGFHFTQLRKDPKIMEVPSPQP